MQFLSNPMKSLYLMCAAVSLIFSLLLQAQALGETKNEVTPAAVKQDSASDFEYEIESETVTITRYKGSEEYVVVPSQINGRPVRKIGSEAFQFNRGLRAVTIPQGAVTAGVLAFFDCGGSPAESRTLLLPRESSCREIARRDTNGVGESN